MFRARLPSLFSTSHKMPRPPWNLHVVATSRSPDNAICKSTQHDKSKVLRLPREMTMEVAKSAALATKTATHLLKAMQKYCVCHTKRFLTRYETRWNVTKCHACHAKRDYATSEASKSDHCAIGTAIGTSRGRLRTVVTLNATSSEHTLNPQTPGVKREPLLRIREKGQRVSQKCRIYQQSWEQLPNNFRANKRQSPLFSEIGMVKVPQIGSRGNFFQVNADSSGKTWRDITNQDGELIKIKTDFLKD